MFVRQGICECYLHFSFLPLQSMSDGLSCSHWVMVFHIQSACSRGAFLQASCGESPGPLLISLRVAWAELHVSCSASLEGHQGHSSSCVCAWGGSPGACFMLPVPGCRSSPLAIFTIFKGGSMGLRLFMFPVPGESHWDCSSSCLFCCLSKSPPPKCFVGFGKSGICPFGEGILLYSLVWF